MGSLVTIDEAKLLGARGSNEKIAFLISSISARFDDYCGQELTVSARTERIAGTGGKELQLTSRPLQSITSILEDGVALAANEYSVLDASQGILYREAGWVRRLPAWPDLTLDPIPDAAEKNYTVSYVAGFAQVPPDLKEACIREVCRALSRPANLDLVAERTPGGWTQQWSAGSRAATNFDPDTLRVLNSPKYRRIFYR